ncbi:MAG: DNA-binding protein WhiA, partial [Clostridia bacterium]|nr:DNA-binding protein WhiA [Clostridia bacterium]
KALKNVYIVDDGTGNVVVEDAGVIEKIYDLFGYEYNNASLHINRAVVEEDCCREAFIRGAFLASGYLSNPEKEYHMEFVTTHFNISSELLILLDEMEFSAKMINRRGNYVIYYKGSEMIEKMLTFMGASNSAMELMLKKVEKNLKNNINRKVNCEISNLTKTADASAQQIEAIYTLKEKNKYDELPKPLKEVAELRLANPELTLGELAQMCVPPITKPGLSGRMRKIIKLAKDA